MLDRVIADNRRVMDYIHRAEQSGRLTKEQQKARERQEREQERLQRQKEDQERLKIAKELAEVEGKRWEAEARRVTTARENDQARTSRLNASRVSSSGSESAENVRQVEG